METLTTLVCLFHHGQQAQAALTDLRKAGVPDSATWLIGGDGASVDALDKSDLASVGMPDHDYDHLKEGIRDGGVVVAVSATSDKVDAVESIFTRNKAEKIDDVAKTQAASLAAAKTTDENVIPVIEENLVVGKRTVDAGGVRLFRRVIEIPAEEAVTLREEHVHVDRMAVDRPITDADQAFAPRQIELTETAEEAVVGKETRVVEEIVVGKKTTEHTETIHDTVRHTEVEMEELPGESIGQRTPVPSTTY